MIIGNIHININPIQISWNTAFNYFKSNILTNQSEWWKNEDIYDKSCKLYTINNFLLAQIYCTLIYYEFKTIGKNLTLLESKYDYTNMSKCFKCSNIDIKKMLEFYGIYLNNVSIGINSIGIENTFIIEPSINYYNSNLISIIDLHNSIINQSCINLLNINC